MPSQQLDSFTTKLSQAGLREVDVAVALIWFETHSDLDMADVTAKEVADLIIRQRLSGNVNVSRLNQALVRHADTVKGHREGSYRIRKSSDTKLSERFSEYVDLSKAAVKDLLISNSIELGGRRPLEAIRREANGAYERGFYNSSAVMCRRLAEMLLIEALEKNGAADSIRDANDNILAFSDLISVAKSGQYVKLSRSAPSAFSKLKELGDAGAHHRYFVAVKKNLDDLNPGYALLISELSSLALT